MIGDSYDNIYILDTWDEATGVLKEVDIETGRIIFQTFIIHMGPNGFESIRHIRALVGELVSILRTNLPDFPYIVIHHEPCAYSQGPEPGQPPDHAGCASHLDKETDGGVPEEDEDECR